MQRPLTRLDQERAYRAARNEAAYRGEGGCRLRNETQARAAAWRAMRIAETAAKRGPGRELAIGAVQARADSLIAFRAVRGWEGRP